MKTITEIWLQLESWAKENKVQFNPGATETDIVRLETELSFTVPDQMRESLLRHNGVSDEQWAYWELLSVDGIIRETKLWRTLVADGTLGENDFEPESQLQPYWWGPGFIAITADGGGNGMVIDMEPGDTGTTAQIVDMDHEIGPSYYSDTYAEWLWDEAKQILGSLTTDET